MKFTKEQRDIAKAKDKVLCTIGIDARHCKGTAKGLGEIVFTGPIPEADARKVVEFLTKVATRKLTRAK